MKIKGTVQTEMVISRDEMASIAVATISAAMNFDPSWAIEDGEVIEYKTHYTSHSWDERRVLRKATDQDVAAWNTFAAIQRWRYT